MRLHCIVTRWPGAGDKPPASRRWRDHSPSLCIGAPYHRFWHPGSEWTQSLRATLAGMPFLTLLSWQLGRDCPDLERLHWPRTLKSVFFSFRPGSVDIPAETAQLNVLLELLSGHETLEQVILVWRRDPRLPGGIALEPLLSLPRLHTLTIRQNENGGRRPVSL